MNSIWQEFLAASGARVDQNLVTDFGDAPAERAAALAATIVSPLTHLRLIEVAGPEAGEFLHHQFTSDIRHLATDAVQHSAWCSAKGRMLASFLVFRAGPDYRLQLSADLLTPLLKRLQMFVLRSKVTITDPSGDRELIGLAGPQAAAILPAVGLPLPAEALSSAVFAGGVVIRLDSSRFEIIVDGNAAIGLWPLLCSHASPVGTPVWQWLDIEAGVPLISERTQEEFVPQMADFERSGGVSFHKGCYPGQEIIARTQYLGKVKRHLYRIHSGSPIAIGDAIYSPANPEHPCGMVANAAPAPAGGYDALAIVQESFVTDDLELAAPGGPHIDLRRVGH